VAPVAPVEPVEPAWLPAGRLDGSLPVLLELTTDGRPCAVPVFSQVFIDRVWPIIYVPPGCRPIAAMPGTSDLDH